MFASIEVRPFQSSDIEPVAGLLDELGYASTVPALAGSHAWRRLRRELCRHFDFSIFLRAGFEVTVARAEARDLELLGRVEEVRRRYRERYVPGQRLYLAEAEPERQASIAIDNDDPERPVMVRQGSRA